MVIGHIFLKAIQVYKKNNIGLLSHLKTLTSMGLLSQLLIFLPHSDHVTMWAWPMVRLCDCRVTSVTSVASAVFTILFCCCICPQPSWRWWMLGPANLATSGLNNLEMCISARMTNGGSPAHVAHVSWHVIGRPVSPRARASDWPVDTWHRVTLGLGLGWTWPWEQE